MIAYLFRIGIPESRCEEVAGVLINLYSLFLSKDATMVEINPFAEDASGNYFCLDAKLRFDDNAEFRQKEVFDQVHLFTFSTILLDENTLFGFFRGTGLKRIPARWRQPTST